MKSLPSYRRSRIVTLSRDDVAAAIMALDMSVCWLSAYDRLSLEQRVDTAKAMKQLRAQLAKA